MIRFTVVALFTLCAVLQWSAPVFSQPVRAQAPHIGEGGLPQFDKDPAWPKVPAKWKIGFVSAVAVDDQDHVWLLNRPRDVRASKDPDKKPATVPPVMEFDNDGNFIQGWGGESGPGYQWPTNEHGISVDSKGFVWIVGNAIDRGENRPNDNQVLKFTKDGKFVMAIGKSGQVGSNKTEILSGAAVVRYYAKTNELFVADGYGNSRVIVFDADTGKMKRMWGAYGDKPLDKKDRPPSIGGATWLVHAQEMQQFGSPVHDLMISDDGLVYVCDRYNRRVQVFTTEGVFVAEQFAGSDSLYFQQSRSVAFSPDQRFLYVSGSPDIFILNRKTLEVLGAFDIMDGKVPGNPIGHLIAADHKGNIYAVGARGANKWVFKGYSAVTKCCQGPGVHADNSNVKIEPEQGGFVGWLKRLKRRLFGE